MPVGPVSLQQLRDAWPEIVEVVEKSKRTAWMVVVTATVQAFADDVLTLTFPSAVDVESFKKPQGAGEGVSEHLRRAIQQVLGVKVKYIARVEGPADAPGAPTGATGAPVAPAPAETPASAAPAPAAAPRDPAPASPVAPTPVDEPRTQAERPPQAESRQPAEPRQATQPPQATPPRQVAEPRQAAAPSRPAPSAGPVTGWDVAPIPQTGPPEPDEPEYITEEPPGGAPTVDAAPLPADVVAPGTSAPATSAPATRPAATPAAAPAASGRTAPPAGAPAADRRAAAGDPRRGIPSGSRYGEAVVREILNAQFIEEETIAPRVTPQRSE